MAESYTFGKQKQWPEKLHQKIDFMFGEKEVK